MEATASISNPTGGMMTNRIYSPQLSAPVVKALYFEAKSKGMPMTRLADSILRNALQATESWQHVGEINEQENRYSCQSASGPRPDKQ
ncbi:MAG: hypothetical protein ABI254_10285 [Chthoniobacterales bacterium]